LENIGIFAKAHIHLSRLLLKLLMDLLHTSVKGLVEELEAALITPPRGKAGID